VKRDFKKILLICFVFLGLFLTGYTSLTPSNLSKNSYLKLDSTLIEISEFGGDLDVPWEIVYNPGDNQLWFTEQNGSIFRLNTSSGKKEKIFQLEKIYYKKSTGLFGMALHPNWKETPYVYLVYTDYTIDQDHNDNIFSKVVRYKYNGKTLIEPKNILDHIPGKVFHNGARLAISPDHKLYITTGDIGETHLCQDVTKLNGKILRINLDGSIPADNPFPNNPVWSWGHRNQQGLAFASNGKLYASEHGPATDDEVNLIQKGANYGWPNVHGYCDTENEKAYCADSVITEPLLAWSPTVAVAGLQYYSHDAIPEWKNTLLAANMKGRALRILDLNEAGDKIEQEHIFFQKRYGRIRDVAVAPNGDVYFSTTNTDWHPRNQAFMYDTLPPGGDRIIRLRKANKNILAGLQKKKVPIIREDQEAIQLQSEKFVTDLTGDVMGDGKKLYTLHCAACHQPNGTGVPETFPPLAGTDWVTGNKPRLIRTVLEGMSEPIVVNGQKFEQEMPSFNILSNRELALILTYIRGSFGNKAGEVLENEIFEERKGQKK
jgi:glucose/arabinose dehydrogenase/mono/diheme cytochrome c family protein